MKRQILTFRAATMDDAMDLVRRELGQDAVVLDSKAVATRRMLPWPSTRQEIEVSAERTLCPIESETSQIPQQKQPTAKRNTPGCLVEAGKVRTVQTLAESIVSRGLCAKPLQIPADKLAPPPPWLLSELGLDTDQSAVALIPEVKLESSPTVQLAQQLAPLESMVAQLGRHSRPEGIGETSTELSTVYRNLLEVEVEDEIARELIAKMGRTLDLSPSAVTTMLQVLIEREVRCAPPIRPRTGHREIITLIGPTGVGKTTTLAKLAGHFQCHAGLRVGLITVDQHRVGAVEQLQTYAEIMQVPFRTASSPVELRAAIDGLDDVDLILIDTAGRSPKDNQKLAELRELMRVANPDHVLLVLSLIAGPRSISWIAEQFASAGPTSLVLTKLDETAHCGSILSATRRLALPIQYLTTGQNVPDQIETANPQRIARLILGQEKISGDQSVDGFPSRQYPTHP